MEKKNVLNRNLKLIMILVFSMLFFIQISFSVAPWWDSSYEYRENLNVSTGTNNPYNGYQNYTVQINLDTTGNLFLDNGNDLRIVFYNGSSNVELDREIIDMNSVNTRVRFSLQRDISASSVDSGYYLYYNYDSAGIGPSNLTNVYLWYDDASSDRESEYIQGKVDSSAHGNQWRNSISWNAGGYYSYDTADNYVDSMRPSSLIERDIYLEYEDYMTDAYPNDLTTGPICRWQGTGSGSSEDSSHFYYYEMAESTILAGSYASHDTITADARASTVINYGLLPLFPANSWTRLGIAAWGTNPTNIKAYYNNESGGFGGYRFSGTHAAASDNEGAGQFGPWLQQEEGRIKNIIARRYIEPEPSLLSFNQTNYRSELNVTYISVSPAVTYFVNQNDTINISANISCSTSFLNSCGDVTIIVKYNVSSTGYSNISNVSGSIPFWTTSTQPQICSLNGGDSCSVEFLVNATGVIGGYYDLIVDSSSNMSSVYNESGDDITVRIVDSSIVAFNVSKYSFGEFAKNSGNRKVNLSVVSNIGDNSNIKVACESGDCFAFSDNFSDGISLLEGQSSVVEFICLDDYSGFHSAIFNVTSDEHFDKALLNISCNVTQIFGPISLNHVSLDSTFGVNNSVGVNQTFKLNVTLNCVGSCGNVTVYAVLNRPKSGLVASDPADSGWQIVNDYSHLNSGKYWIKTSQMASADEVYIDMSYDRGGWMLVGRGREGWSWNDAGRGVASNVANIPTGSSAFSPTYYSSAYIDDLLNETDLDSLSDGVRLRRATSTDGSTWQNVIWNFSTQNNWDWNFDSTYALSDYITDGTNHGADDTRDASPFNDNRRTFTYALASHNNQQGFSFGASQCAGTNTPTNYLWEYAVECNSVPFTQVYVRPHTNSVAAGLISTSSSSVPVYSLEAIKKSCVPIEDGSCSFEWVLNATGAVNETFNLSVIAFSNISSINYVVAANATVKIVDNIAPTINLFEPVNGSKVIGSNNFSFVWKIDDDKLTSNCSLYLNGILNQSVNCSKGLNTTINLTLNSGAYSWFVNVTDEDNNSVLSDVWDFYLIQNYSARVSKKITSENSGMYTIRNVVYNLVDMAIDIVVLDFVDLSFNYGSFNVVQDITNVTSGAFFNGTVLGWDLSYVTNSSFERNYSIAGLGDYVLGDEFVVGLD